MNNVSETAELRTKPDGRARGPSAETAEKIEQIRALREAGLSWREIGASLGVSKQRAHAIANRREDGTDYLREAKNSYARRQRGKTK